MKIYDWLHRHSAVIGIVLAAIPLLAGAYWYLADDQVTLPEGPTAQATVDTGGGDITGNVTINQFTQDAYGAQLRAQLDRIEERLNAPNASATLRAEKVEIEARLANLQNAYDEHVEDLRKLRLQLADIGEGIPTERVEAAQQALYEGDTALADRIFAEVEAMEQNSIDRASNAAYQRGLIAEEEVRWLAAANHYKRAAALAPNYDRLNKAGEFLLRAGRGDEAVRFWEELVSLSERENGVEAAKTGTAVNNLAEGYRVLGRYEEAEPLYRRAIEIGKVTLGTQDANYAIRLNNFALLLRSMHRFSEAEEYYRKAIEIDKATIGLNHPDYAIHLSNLANLLRRMGQFTEAEQLFLEAIEVDKLTIGVQHPEYATRLGNFAGLLHDMRRYEEAEKNFRKAIEIGRTAIGEEHPNYAIRLNNLANLLRDMRRFDEAEPLYEQALATLDRRLGAEHPTTKKVKANREAFRAARAAAGD